MDLKELISEALSKPHDSISYFISRELAHRFSDKEVVEDALWSFDLNGYAKAELCSIVAETRVFNESRFGWSRSGKDLEQRPENAWFNVLWKGHLMDVLIVTWTEEGYRRRHHWVIADSRAVAEEFIREVCDWANEVRGEILVYDGGDWCKDKELFETIKSATFDNIVLPSDLKSEIRNDMSHFLSSREVYDRYRIPWKRGVLLIGPPGNGKTHTVKALINGSKTPCIYVKTFTGCWGTDQDRIREVFEKARKITPSIVVLEDIDSLINISNRAFFLNELDGFASNTGVVVLATTNHPERLDPAILDRPSRFDRKYYFNNPAAAERYAYVSSWNSSVDADLRISGATISKVVDATEGYSFAYLKELALSSMMVWISEGNRTQMDSIIINRAEILTREMKSGSQPKKKKNKEKKKARKASGIVVVKPLLRDAY